MRGFTVPMLLLAASSIAFHTNAEAQKIAKRLTSSRDVLQELVQTPDKGIPLDIAAKAQCVAVIPGMKKGAFGIGGEYGQGVATCRTSSGWSAPVFIQLTGASFGFQIGGQSTDLVLVGVTHKSLDDLLKDKVKLGGDLAVAAGPVGRNSQASTTELANAEFLTYSRSRGLFAGIDLTGDVVHQNTKDTKELFGQDQPYKAILGGSIPTPGVARGFVQSVNALFRDGRLRKSK